MRWKELAAAIATNNFYEVQQLLISALEEKIPIDTINDFSKYYQGDEIGLNTLLNWAVYHKDADIVQLLLVNGADPNVRSGRSYQYNNPLHFAVLGHYGKIARLILQDPRTQISATSDGEKTAFHLACKKNYPVMVQLLLYYVKRRGLDIDSYLNAVTLKKKSLLHYAVKYSDAVIVNILLKNNVLLWQKNHNGATPLHGAMSCNTIEVIRCLLDHGFENLKTNVNCKNLWGNTALHILRIDLSPDDALKIAKWLLKAGTDVHAENKAQSTPLQWAAHMGQLRVVKLFLEAGADVNHQDRFGKTALHHASNAKNLEIMYVLAEKGCDPLRPNQKGESAIKDLSTADQENLLQIYCRYERARRDLPKTFPLESIALLVRAKYDPILTPWFTEPLSYLPFFSDQTPPLSQQSFVNKLADQDLLDLKDEEVVSKKAIQHTSQLPVELRIIVWSAFLFVMHIGKTIDYKDISQDHIESLFSHINYPD